MRAVHLDAYAASRDGVLDELIADGTYSLCMDRPARFVLPVAKGALVMGWSETDEEEESTWKLYEMVDSYSARARDTCMESGFKEVGRGVVPGSVRTRGMLGTRRGSPDGMEIEEVGEANASTLFRARRAHEQGPPDRDDLSGSGRRAVGGPAHVLCLSGGGLAIGLIFPQAI